MLPKKIDHQAIQAFLFYVIYQILNFKIVSKSLSIYYKLHFFSSFFPPLTNSIPISSYFPLGGEDAQERFLCSPPPCLRS